MSSEEKLVKMLKYVSEHNDFYKNRIKEYGISNPLDITQWPVLTRKELQENRYNMFSEGYKNRYYNQQLRRQSSSGSTGMPVNVYWDYKDWYASNMCLWRKRREWYGIRPQDKYCVFTLNAFGITPEEGKIYYINEPGNILSFNVSLIREESGYEKIAMKINEFAPDWLYIQPFVLNQLINAYGKLGAKPAKTIRYIESVGEILTSDLRRRAEKLFNLRITNMYGSEEMNGIAIEDLNGEMQVLTDNVFLEVRNEESVFTQGEGEAIITNLNNFAMPLIRYGQGDGVYCSTDNTGSNMFLNSVNGRAFIGMHGNLCHFSTLSLLESVAEINNTFGEHITEYSFDYYVKKRLLKCSIRIVPKTWFNRISEELKNNIQKKIENDILVEIAEITGLIQNKSVIKIWE